MNYINALLDTICWTKFVFWAKCCLSSKIIVCINTKTYMFVQNIDYRYFVIMIYYIFFNNNNYFLMHKHKDFLFYVGLLLIGLIIGRHCGVKSTILHYEAWSSIKWKFSRTKYKYSILLEQLYKLSPGGKIVKPLI